MIEETQNKKFPKLKAGLRTMLELGCVGLVAQLIRVYIFKQEFTYDRAVIGVFGFACFGFVYGYGKEIKEMKYKIFFYISAVLSIVVLCFALLYWLQS